MKHVATMLIVFVLFGCATTYKPFGFGGGYSEVQLGENIFQVSFRGNNYTSEERASAFSLLRSAELTINNGFRYFRIIDSEKSSKVSAATAYDGGNINFMYKPRASNTIACFKEKPESSGLVFDAVFVIKSIRQKYGLDKDK